ncbi:hypothetical protein [Micromonospora okii]|uniref:hypothetical protein n=1 Tax=Micromonospora okii TaxID=1182970 RepID=UPI001E329FAA|nr:hypothetical protein [Micromonospora okii]
MLAIITTRLRRWLLAGAITAAAWTGLGGTLHADERPVAEQPGDLGTVDQALPEPDGDTRADTGCPDTSGHPAGEQATRGQHQPAHPAHELAGATAAQASDDHAVARLGHTRPRSTLPSQHTCIDPGPA